METLYIPRIETRVISFGAAMCASASQDVSYFFWLAQKVFVLKWHIAFLICVALGGLALRTHRRYRLSTSDALRAALLPLLPVFLLIWGTIKRSRTADYDWYGPEVQVLNIFTISAILILIVNVCLSKGRRLLMTAWSIQVLVWILVAQFCSEISITGDCMPNGDVMSDW